MIFSRINLQSELVKERNKQHQLLDEIHELLENAKEKDEEILERLHSTQAEKELGIRIREEDRGRIFSLTEIKEICIQCFLKRKKRFRYTCTPISIV